MPVYGTPLTLALVAERLREHGLAETADLRRHTARAQRIEVGPFGVEAIRVTHSIVDGIGLAIDTPAGTIVHTGDFKLDPSPLDGELPDYRRFAELGERGVLVLCSDSTNVERPGHTPLGDGRGRRRSARASTRRAGGSSSPPSPRTSIASSRCSRSRPRTDRRVALLGHEHAAQRDDRRRARLPARARRACCVPLEELVRAAARPPGDPLDRAARASRTPPWRSWPPAEHKYVRVERGDLVIISARVIPGNERTIGRVVNALYRLGAEVLYEDNAFVHVSGHASQEDLKLMFNLTRPRYFIPVHGEYRHLLGHARLAESVGITPDRVFLIEDGMGVEVSPTAARVAGRFPAGRVLVDGKSVGDIGAVVLRDRQLLAEDGLIAVSLAVDRHGAVVAGPEIASRGVRLRQGERAPARGAARGRPRRARRARSRRAVGPRG